MSGSDLKLQSDDCCSMCVHRYRSEFSFVEDWIRTLPEDPEGFEPITMADSITTGDSKKRKRTEMTSRSGKVTKPSGITGTTQRTTNDEAKLRAIGVTKFNNLHLEFKNPGTMKKLLDRVNEIALGVKVLPANITKELSQHRQEIFLYDGAMYKSTRTEEDERFTLKVALDVKKAAHPKTRVGENNWGESVIAPLLRVALQSDDTMYYCNVTQAKMPQELKPDVDNLPAGTMVDYVMGMAPVLEEGKSITKMCQKTSLQTISPTTGTVAEDPVAVIIEVKVDGSNGGQARSYFQLSSWYVGQIKLWQMMGATRAFSDTLLLPLLSVQGSQWFLSILAYDTDGSKVLHKELCIGSVGDLLGAYKVIAALRALYEWISDEYRPWYNANVLVHANDPAPTSHVDLTCGAELGREEYTGMAMDS